MKALTVQQPWAWAIVHGGKDVENRTQAWSYRGPLAIHAGARWSTRGQHSELMAEAYFDARIRQGWMVVDRPGAVRRSAQLGLGRFVQPEYFGALIGVVDLVDVHLAAPEMREGKPEIWEAACCSSPWGQHGPGARVHLVLENPRPLDRPIPCRGALGLWTPPADVLDELREAL